MKKFGLTLLYLFLGLSLISCSGKNQKEDTKNEVNETNENLNAEEKKEATMLKIGCV